MLLALSVVLVSWILSSFSDPSLGAERSYKDWFLEVDERVRAEIETMIRATEYTEFGPYPIEAARASVAEVRKAYKAMEWWSAYVFPEYTEEYLNGAPIIQSARLDNRSFARLPEGLQVLDEAVWEEAPDGELRSKTAQDALQFRNRFFVMRNALKDRAPQPGEVAVAMRIGLVRMFSLGLSGFDTPGSANALPEAEETLKSMKSCIGWLGRGDAENRQLSVLFDAGIAQVEEGDFERFDRLAFLTEVLDPLYAALYAPGQQPGDRAWNPESRSLFAPDFLDPYFFSELKADSDSEDLRRLGKKLFNDPLLSHDNTLSCAGCHPSDRAFQDGLPKAVAGYEDRTLERNTPGLINSVYADRYFADLRAYTLEQQAEHVIFNSAEFNTDYIEILDKLNASKAYKKDFRAAFGQSKAGREEVQKALASYVLSLRSFNSPFDRYVRGESAQIGDDVRRGFNVFMGKAACGTCHFAPVFSGLLPPEFRKSESEVIGVLRRPFELEEMPSDAVLDPDSGRFNNGVPSEQLQIYRHSFKTSTVRNAGLTAPYFHNGAYPDLASVLHFYNHGGAAGIGLDLPIQTLAPDSLGLTEPELADLEAFILSLNDAAEPAP